MLNITQEFSSIPLDFSPMVQTVIDMYDESINDILPYTQGWGLMLELIIYSYFNRKLNLHSLTNLTIGPVSPERLEKYDQVLLGILRRHKFIQFYVSNAVLDFKHHMTSENSRELTRKIPFFLNRFFTNRASARMLIHQYRKYTIWSK